MDDGRRRGREAVVCVVDDVDDVVVVWWVNCGLRPQPDFSRLCGAWTIPENADDIAGLVENVTFGRTVLPTQAGEGALARLGVFPPARLDLQGTFHAATGAVAAAEAFFKAEEQKRPGKLKPPRWPVFPILVDIENPAGAKAVKKARQAPVAHALMIARWLSGLCSVWEEFESERRARPLLRDRFGPERDLPVVTRP